MFNIKKMIIIYKILILTFFSAVFYKSANTEEINEKLGKVTQTKPTEEMFQEKVDVKESVFDQNFSEW